MIEIKNLYKSYGSLEVLKDISFKIEKGDIFGIIGQSGAGKSTLLRCFNGLENFQKGEVIVDGQAISSLNKKQIKRNVMKLSGGQQQRVAIARALVSNAPIILADEPTGNLDSVTAGEIIDILKTLAKDKNKCVIVVTHSKEVADSADIILELSGKKLKKVNKMNLEVE